MKRKKKKVRVKKIRFWIIGRTGQFYSGAEARQAIRQFLLGAGIRRVIKEFVVVHRLPCKKCSRSYGSRNRLICPGGE